jgi:hypothetical protein
MIGMALHWGRSGSSARGLANKRRQTLNILLLVVLVIGTIYFLLLRSGLGVVGMLVLIVVFKVVMDFLTGEITHQRRRERQALRGAKGEDRVADVLDDLPDDYVVFHDIDTGNGDIDHVLISPEGGVFLLETKAHGGRVSFDGDNILINEKPPERNFIGQVLRNAFWLKDDIKRQTGKEVWINSALVFANAFVERHPPIKGVLVINRTFLMKFLASNRPRRPDPDLAMQLEFIHSSA